MDIYFVISLPRTGTTSLCEMDNLCGLNSLHVLMNISFIEALDQGYNFFADTPFYNPEFIIGLLESGLQDRYNIKFIYSKRETASHQNSLNKLFNKWKPPNKIYNKLGLLDNLLYNKLDSNYTKNHYGYIKKISTLYKIEILEYTFNKGWKNFCDFIKRPIPNSALPHRNKL
jgi:hypothetical protein